MEFNDLRIFQVVAYEKSISKAALKLGYAQSNITMRIKLLENKLNTTLFIRNNRGIIITPEGEKLLKYADKILELVDKAIEDFTPPKINPQLKIGAPQTISASILPKLFTLLHKKNPEISLVLKTEKQDVLLDMLIKGELDGTFISGDYASAKFKDVFNFKEKFALISSMSINDTNNIITPIIINSDINCPYRNLFLKWLASNSSRPSAVIEFDTLEAILGGITEGLGISLLPIRILPKNHNFFVYKLEREFNELTIKFIVNKDIKPNTFLKNFINIAHKHLNDSSK